MNVTVLIFDSVTKLPPEAAGAVVIGASHGAVSAAQLSASAGVRAAIHHDAGIGLDEAGVGGLAYAQSLGLAMAAVAAASARIGDGQDMAARGVISRVNRLAADCGVEIGMRCADAAERLKAAPWPYPLPPPKPEGRHRVAGVLCMDSAVLVVPQDRGLVLAAGSHGALNSGRTMAPIRPRLVLFNDAGPGIDRGGVLGVDLLDSEGIAAGAVAALSARIGDGRSTLQDGTLSTVNRAAYRLGLRVGSPALALARAVAENG
jgi:uncharacterized protein YunC (DUF1805 family)